MLNSIDGIGLKKFLKLKSAQLLLNVRNETIKNILPKRLNKYVKSHANALVKNHNKYMISTLYFSKKYMRRIKVDEIYGYLNHDISSNISEIQCLKEIFEKVLGFDPGEGLCQLICRYVVISELKNKEEFQELFGRYNAVSEKDLIEHPNTKNKETRELSLILSLLRLLPVFRAYNTYFRKEDPCLLMDQAFKFHPEFGDKVPNNITDKLMESLKKLPQKHYAEYVIGIVNYDKKGKKFSTGHDMLIYKTENDRYFFFDPNYGVVGANCSTFGKTGIMLHHVVETMKRAISLYITGIVLRDMDEDMHKADTYECVVGLMDTTSISQGAKKYNTEKNPESHIVDLCITNGHLTSELVLPSVLQ